MLLVGSAPARAQLAYRRIPQTFTTTDLTDVAWHPGGAFALVLARDGKVLRYDAPADATAEAVVLEGTLDGTPQDLAFAPDGTFALVAGARYARDAAPEARIWRYDPARRAFDEVQALRMAGREHMAAAFRPGTTQVWLVTINQRPDQLFCHHYDTVTGELEIAAARATSGGVVDGAWRADGREGLAVVGINSRAAYRYDPALTGDLKLRDVDYRGSNATDIKFHPINDFAVITDLSGNLYGYDGRWASRRPGLNAPFYGVAWNDDGTRALIVGRPVGVSVRGTVWEFTGQRGSEIDAAHFVDRSIPDFAAAPWFGDFDANLLGVAWRPRCAAGLIAGGHGGGPEADFGMLIAFEDAVGARCRPAPGATPTPSPSPSATPTAPSPSPTPTPPRPTPSPAPTPSPSPTATPSSTPTRPPTPGPSVFPGGNGRPCGADLDCPADFLCEPAGAGVCRRVCREATDCDPGLVCNARALCVPPSPSATASPAPTPTATATPAPNPTSTPGPSTTSEPPRTRCLEPVPADFDAVCQEDRDCRAGLHCRRGRCGFECLCDRDCRSDETCDVDFGRCGAGGSAAGGGCTSGETSRAWFALGLLLARRRRRRGDRGGRQSQRFVLK